NDGDTIVGAVGDIKPVDGDVDCQRVAAAAERQTRFRPARDGLANLVFLLVDHRNGVAVGVGDVEHPRLVQQGARVQPYPDGAVGLPFSVDLSNDGNRAVAGNAGFWIGAREWV